MSTAFIDGCDIQASKTQHRVFYVDALDVYRFTPGTCYVSVTAAAARSGVL